MLKLKEKIKNIKFVNSFIENKRMKKVFLQDYEFFKKNYMKSKECCKSNSYNIILLCHSIEKGLSNDNPRFFGSEKILNLIKLLNKECDNYSFTLGNNILNKWCEFCQKNYFTDYDTFKSVKKYLNNKTYNLMNVGAYEISKEDLLKDRDKNFYNLLKTRHSIRRYSDKIIEDDKIREIVNTVLLTPSACNRQMCKIYFVKQEKLKKEILFYGKGFGNFNTDHANFFVITFDLMANHVVDERNQGWFNAGLLSMNLVNTLHSNDIGSCFVQFSNSIEEEIELKNKLNISSSERIAVIISCGYYEEKCKVLYSERKKIDDIFAII